MIRSQEAIVNYCKERGLEEPKPEEDGSYALVFDDTIRILLSAPDRRHVLCRYDVAALGESPQRALVLSRNLRLVTALMAEQEAVLSFDEQQDLLFLFQRLQVEADGQERFDRKVDDFVDQVERYREIVEAID